MAFASRDELLSVRNDHNLLYTDVVQMKTMLTDMAVEIQKLNAGLAQATMVQNKEIEEFEDKVKGAVTRTKVELDNTIHEAKKKFEEQEQTLSTQAQHVAQQSLHLGQLQQATETEMMRVKNEMQDLYTKAAGGWEQHEARLNGLHEATRVSVQDLQVKINKLESNGSGINQGTDRVTKGYLPMKNIVPHTVKGDVQDWR